MLDAQHAADALIYHSSWPDGVLLIDRANRVLELTPKARELLQYNSEQEVGKTLHQLLCPENRAVQHEAEQCPLHALNPDGLDIQSAWWKSGSGDLLNVDYRIFDLTEGARARRVISFNETSGKLFNHQELSKFAHYVEHSPTAMAEFDGDGQMIFANEAMQDALLDNGFNEQGQANILPIAVQNRFREGTKDEAASDLEIDLGQRWLHWHFFELSHGGQQTTVGYLFDITDRKLSEQRTEQEKAAARRDFYAKMVHELRTPLNAIIGFSQILIRRCKGQIQERELKNLQSILSAGRQLNDMVTDTLDAAKIEAGKMELNIESVDLNAVLSSVYEQLNTLAESKALALEIHCDTSMPFLTDKKKLRQIIVNLISNAIKYTSSGRVCVSLTEQATGHDYGISLCVSDTGVGIPADQIDGLFDSYQQVSATRDHRVEGTGLGLALVAELVNMLEGEISVDSQVAVGSRFTVNLPTLHKSP